MLFPRNRRRLGWKSINDLALLTTVGILAERSRAGVRGGSTPPAQTYSNLTYRLT
jgi:hypothetical protein